MKKTLIVVGIVLVILIFTSWKFIAGFLFGFALAYVLFRLFGEKKIQNFMDNTIKAGKNKWNAAKDSLHNESLDTCIDSSTVIETKRPGWYQVIIVADGKCLMLEPSNSRELPQDLQQGTKITIKTTRNITSKGIEVKTTIITTDNSYEVV